MTVHSNPSHATTQDSELTANSDAPWDEFDPTAYFAHNYLHLRADDTEILRLTRDHFVRAELPGGLHGVDVGTGSNLYPALAILPWCRKITMVERATHNVAWLERELAHGYSTDWDQFWSVLAQRDCYRDVADPRAQLSAAAHVQQGSVFDLPRQEWDIGTMFFVACSISNVIDEFEQAVDSFLQALRPGAPFAMAYMENSKGYEVSSQEFPAVEVGVQDVRRCVEAAASDVQIHRIPSDSLRVGYTGMLVALGRARPTHT
ncbi:SCO2525 family SAM-dependent methyltransferase [Frankia sp. R82]|uniref:SCO2525 family SAM-dependent methyltransferase n=1 Tax=Frankia sp. R82 TaxID=2950553 RepID=UPI0020430D42|nr:SCO2525 family SAM-dependent methyltransferase [Frankia sp. R82]MCM3882077.1 SCO2525 family SAM-dependent methyltransferase [Frankia sp. R82]